MDDALPENVPAGHSSQCDCLLSEKDPAAQGRQNVEALGRPLYVPPLQTRHSDARASTWEADVLLVLLLVLLVLARGWTR